MSIVFCLSVLHKKSKLHLSLSFFPTFYIFDEKTILLCTEPIVALSELLLYSSACFSSMLNHKYVKFPGSGMSLHAFI